MIGLIIFISNIDSHRERAKNYVRSHSFALIRYSVRHEGKNIAATRKINKCSKA